MAQQLTQQEQLQQTAYNALNNYFNAHTDEVVEIEILPPSHEPVGSLILEDGPNLGLAKKILVLAFLHARHLFFADRKLGVAVAPSQPASPEIKALEATRVILLFDPEHLTATNHRKRHFQSLQDGGTRYLHAQAELRFLDGILTSPLHRQSKSPTLWGYRGLLMAYLLPVVYKGQLSSPEFRCGDDDVLKLVARELSAVCKSGERHPKNYYAWQYARGVLEIAHVSLSGESDPWNRLIRQCVETVKSWCYTHPSDISGWTFLAWLLQYAGQDRSVEIVREVVDYAVSLELGNDSLWVFLRTVISDGTLRPADMDDITRDLCVLSTERVLAREVSVFLNKLSETLIWLDMYDERTY